MGTLLSVDSASTVTLLLSGFHRPSGMDIDPLTGDIYLAERRGQILRVTPTLEVETIADGFVFLDYSSGFETDTNDYFVGMRFSPTGDLFVVDPGTHSIYKISRNRVIADAGPDRTKEEGSLVTLDGSASTGENLTFSWSQLAGPAVSLSDPAGAQPTFTAPTLAGGFGSQVVTFELTVWSGGQSSSDTVDITVVNVNHAPQAEAGAEQVVKEGSFVTLAGGDSFDPDGDAITYAWMQTAGTPVVLSETHTATPSFTAPLLPGGIGEVGTLEFALTVSDGALSHTDNVPVVVEQVNHAPVANAGADQTRNEGTMVTLDGTGSSDPDGDPLTSYTWRQVGGPAVALSDANSPTPFFTAPVTGPGGGTFVFKLTVSDGLLNNEPAAAEPDEHVTINVVNVNDPPLCRAAEASPARLWPPDHKMSQVGIVGVSDPDNDQVQITVTGVTQDELLNGLSDGDTSPDAVIQGDKVLLRAERSGKGNGRVYQITFTANDSQATGGSCTGSVKIGVPLSMKPGMAAVDDGQLYDSTRP
ncbi:MAG: hypothetical protein HY695_28330 [Deltaproteobacteria bacterium]|nr:hypothetical protein [Deltaproteobacteria bacterium]